jgi:hypothetical protein
MLMTAPSELTLTLAPERRFEPIDVNARIRAGDGGLLARHRRVCYTSFHTTAGYLDQSLSARLRHRDDVLSRFFSAFHQVFPRDAGYRHDRMELRSELTAAQKAVEPRNADSHLTFIGAGMRNCVTYRAQHNVPVYFIDLDGRSEALQRQRKTVVVGYDHEEVVARASVAVPMSRHPIDSINLADPRLGLLDRIDELVAGAGVPRARVDLIIDGAERNVGLTVNEYETLLMQHDLLEVLRDPLRFARLKGRSLVADPMSIPSKTLNYAAYDVVQVVNSLMDALRLEQSSVERLVAKVMSLPARRFVRARRVSFLAGIDGANPVPRLLRGTYQSPILVQWQPSAARERRIDVVVSALS